MEGRTAQEAAGTSDPAAASSEKARSPNPQGKKGLTFSRFFTEEGHHPFDEISWDLRTASIGNEKGELVFEQDNVEVPSFWSQTATNIVASKYFRGTVGTAERERSARQLIGRVADTLTRWGRQGGYFATDVDAKTFSDELTHLLIHQKASFNSPVWFNCGIEPQPQCSACFINSVKDTMESILTLAKTEGMLFKFGSGTGTNLSPIRSSRENLAGGGTASGPVSFMKGFDAFAGVIKSGGKTRRAAKMVILNVDHPDIEDFINCKVEEEKKAWALMDAGYDGSFTGPAYASVFFQNSNNSVRVADEFMKAALEDLEWHTRAVTTGQVVGTYRARDLLRWIAESTHVCGDPGMQFDTTINEWHTCPATDRINASNPCSEYMFLDDSACNLASLNLMKFRREDGEFDPVAFRRGVQILITAQEIIVDNASYPTKAIERNSYDYRPLGLGYANLGALLMARGLPYDSEEGRDYCAAITALMTGEAYATSARIARDVTGPFTGFEKNRTPFLRVMNKHRSHASRIDSAHVPLDLFSAAREAWDDAVDLGEKNGYRNAQTTVIAPTGTIGFMMDCDTTGIEPDIALVKYKKLVGGGMIKIVNQTVPEALRRLGYENRESQEILEHLEERDTIEGAPHLKDRDLPVFDCAFKPKSGSRSIHYSGHIRMMAAAQPFISGAISKTVNVPSEATPDEIAGAYVDSWKLGLKAIAIYRDGSKRTQPLNTGRGEAAGKQGEAMTGPHRHRLPDERKAITHKFEIAGHQGYLTVGMYEDGSPGELFLVMAKEGSTVSGLMDAFATSISISLQYGVPMKVLVDKFIHMRFEPSGFSKNPEIPMAKSIMDYIFRWLGSKFLDEEEKAQIGLIHREADAAQPRDRETEPSDPAARGAALRLVGGAPGSSSSSSPSTVFTFQAQDDAPSCHECGAIMVRSGSCYKCLNCGATSGCS